MITFIWTGRYAMMTFENNVSKILSEVFAVLHWVYVQRYRTKVKNNFYLTCNNSNFNLQASSSPKWKKSNTKHQRAYFFLESIIIQCYLQKNSCGQNLVNKLPSTKNWIGIPTQKIKKWSQIIRGMLFFNKRTPKTYRVHFVSSCPSTRYSL